MKHRIKLGEKPQIIAGSAVGVALKIYPPEDKVSKFSIAKSLKVTASTIYTRVNSFDVSCLKSDSKRKTQGLVPIISEAKPVSIIVEKIKPSISAIPSVAPLISRKPVQVSAKINYSNFTNEFVKYQFKYLVDNRQLFKNSYNSPKARITNHFLYDKNSIVFGKPKNMRSNTCKNRIFVKTVNFSPP